MPKTSKTGVEIEIRSGCRVFRDEGEASAEGKRYGIKIPPGADRVEVRRTGPGGERAIWSLALSGQRDLKPGERDVQGEIDATTKKLYGAIQNLQFGTVHASLDDLDKIASSVALPAESRYLLAYYRGLLGAKEEDYRTALTELERAAKFAEHAGNSRNVWFAKEAIALRWSDLGRALEASKAYADLAGSPGAKNECEEGELLSNWAWATVLARESGGFPVAGLKEPVPLLEQALHKLNAGPKCDADLFYDAHFNRALAELQAHRTEQATQELEQARAFNKGSTFFQFLWALDLEARLEIERGAPLQALEIYLRLEDQARRAGSPDGELRATLGKARASAALGDRARALDLLAEAESLLDRESLQIPLYEGRQTFLSQREGVASLEIELLLDSGKIAEALAAARRARTRFLLQLASAERVASLSPSDRNVWNEAIKSYQGKRSQADAAARNEQYLLAPQVEPDRAARQALTDEGEQDLDKAFALLGDLPRRQVEPPRPGELLLAFHPLQNGWVAFAAEGRKVISHRFDLDPAVLASRAALAQAVLAPFHDAILRAKRIRILPYGALRGIDFHALPFDGDVLLASRPVVYGLDLAAPQRARRNAEPGEEEALLVADPNDNLPAARREADMVAQAIGRWEHPWKVVRLTSSGATGEETLKHLRKARLFHFSGHGTFAGFGGWESGLHLASKGGLTVGQLLILPHAPRWVVLSGCDTGRAAPEARIEGFGLANALVLAGTEGVVASARPVVDRTAPLLFSHLYDQWRGEGDFAVALQQALLQWRSETPHVDWSSFRIFEP